MAIRFLDPTAEVDRERTVPVKMVPPLTTLAGKTVGMIVGGGAHTPFFETLSALLRERYGVEDVICHKKPLVSLVATPEVYRAFEERCDAVVTGICL